MTDLTQDQLRAYVDRLAVEVCGLKNLGGVYCKCQSNCNDNRVHFDDFINVGNWRPWENLSQAWEVKEAFYIPKNVSLDQMVNFKVRFAKIDFWVLTQSQSARAIFDAAVQAMGWEAK